MVSGPRAPEISVRHIWVLCTNSRKKDFHRHPSYMVFFSDFDDLKTRFLVIFFQKSVNAEISEGHLSAFSRLSESETFFPT